MYDKLLTLCVIGTLVLTCSGDGDGKHYNNPELTTDVKARSGNYQFYYHHKNNLLLTVTGTDCYYSTLDSNGQGMLKYEPQQAEARIIKAIGRNDRIMDTTLITMRSQHQDLLANFHCVGRRIHTLDAKNALRSGDDDSSSSSDEDDD